MQRRSSSNSSSGDLQELWERWATLQNRVLDDPRVASLINTRIGQYLINHPFLALMVMLFSAMSAVPLGLFLTFALVTIVMSAVGFVFFEGFLLFVGGLALLSVLTAIGLFSVVVSVFINTAYITISKLLSRYYPHMTKKDVIQEDDSEGETSTSKEME